MALTPTIVMTRQNARKSRALLRAVNSRRRRSGASSGSCSRLCSGEVDVEVVEVKVRSPLVASMSLTARG
jgi:hypothetical protein